MAMSVSETNATFAAPSTWPTYSTSADCLDVAAQSSVAGDPDSQPEPSKLGCCGEQLADPLDGIKASDVADDRWRRPCIQALRRRRCEWRPRDGDLGSREEMPFSCPDVLGARDDVRYGRRPASQSPRPHGAEAADADNRESRLGASETYAGRAGGSRAASGRGESPAGERSPRRRWRCRASCPCGRGQAGRRPRLP